MAFERLRNGYLEKVNFIGDSNLTILLRDYQTSSTYVHIHRQQLNNILGFPTVLDTTSL